MGCRPSTSWPGSDVPADRSGAYVSQADAIASWTLVAYDELLGTAGRYNGLITYKELSQRVQAVSGITTNQRLDYWIGGLLENVAIEATRRGEPPLTALCVHQDGT